MILRAMLKEFLYKRLHSFVQGNKKTPRKNYNSFRGVSVISINYASRPWQFLNFLPLPQGQGSLRPTVFSTRIGSFLTSRVSC